MRLSFLVKEVDKGWDELRRNMRNLRDGKSYVKVGVFGDSSKNDRGESITNAELALVHEFGSPARGIPERSFIRAPFEANRAAYMAALKALLPGVYENKRPIKTVLGLIGQKAVADIQAYVRQGTNLQANAPSTIARKGSSRPLIDTGRLMQSVTYQVVLSGDPQPEGGTP